MGCNNSVLIKRREPVASASTMKTTETLKVRAGEIIETIEPSTAAQYSTAATSNNHVARKNHEVDVESSSRTKRGIKFHRLDRRRTPKQSATTVTSKIFKCKRSTEKLSTDMEISKKTIIEKSTAADSNTRGGIILHKDSFTRKLSTPNMSTPAIVIDEAPPPSAPPNGMVCSNSVMWDILTSAAAEQRTGNGDSQPVNGISRYRLMSFGRQRSNDKIVAQFRDGDSISDDWVLKIIRCFPFPSPKQSPRNSPPMSPKKALPERNYSDCSFLAPNTAPTQRPALRFLKQKLSDPTHGDGSKYSALGMMVRKTIETTVPPLIPWDVWLRKRLASWTQCSGHQGTVVPATEKTVWKKCAHDSNETKAYTKLMEDAACMLAPRFYKEVEHKGEFFLELEDLSRNFIDPCIMDVKMGTRTFLENEVQNEAKRSDLYDKMIGIDSSEPTAAEQEEKAITKLRYMTFREQLSSTASLGFRIDAAKMSGGLLQKDFQKVRTREQIMEEFLRFFGPNNAAVRDSLLARLRFMKEKIETSEFFASHEVIGSSILIIHDSKNVNAWIIDLAKALPADGRKLDHRTPWTLGNREDGYLFGLDNLIQIIQDLQFTGDQNGCSFTCSDSSKYPNLAPVTVPLP